MTIAWEYGRLAGVRPSMTTLRTMVLIAGALLMRLSRRSRARWHLRRSDRLSARACSVSVLWGPLAALASCSLHCVAGLHWRRWEGLIR